MKFSHVGMLAILISVSAQAEISRVKHPTQMVVKFKEGSAKSLQQSWLAKSKTKLISKNGTALIELPAVVSSEKAMSDVLANSNIEWAAPNYIYYGEARESFTPNDPKFEKQRHHMIIKTPEAWDQSLGKEEVVVAVADDGFDLNHEDMVGSYYVNEGEIADNGIDDDGNGYIDDVIGWNFNDGNNNPSFSTYHGAHGTHVAGSIAAGFNDGVGVTGISPFVKVMPLKFYGDNRWTSAMVYETYAYAADNGANILTVSYNIDSFANDEVFARAVDYVDQKGLIHFNSAGNGNAHQSARTKFGKILLVASTKTKSGSEDERSSFSNYGVDVDVAAPGDPIYSHGRNNQYMDMSGTSMASPTAAAVAALIWSEYPELTREQVVHKLLTSSDDIDGINNSRYQYKLGAGRVNALNGISTETSLTTIRQAWLADGYLHLQLRGLVDGASFGRGAVTVERLSNRGAEEIEITSESNNFDIAQSVMKFKLSGTSRGQYRVRVSSELILDVFGRAIDGDGDGIEGGDFDQTLAL